MVLKTFLHFFRSHLKPFSTEPYSFVSKIKKKIKGLSVTRIHSVLLSPVATTTALMSSVYLTTLCLQVSAKSFCSLNFSLHNVCVSDEQLTYKNPGNN